MRHRAAVRLGAAAAPLVALAALSAGGTAGGAARAAGTVTLQGPVVVDTLRDPAPTFTIRTSGFAPTDEPLVLRLEIALGGNFDAPLAVDMTATGDSATFALPHLLPSGATLAWRARATTAGGASVLSAVAGPYPAAHWLTLRFPDAPNGTSVDTRRPTLVWSATPAPARFAPWRFDVRVQRGDGVVAADALALADTTFTPPVDLETNTPYRWSVTGRLANGDSVRSASRATFVVVDPNTPLVTLLYQNFPNPFPTATASETCFWFDLHVDADVRLSILDIRGHLVRSIVPGPSVASRLPAGRYGRGGPAGGCDGRFTWDGRGDDGRFAPPGVYLAWLDAGGTRSMRKVLFRGH